MTRLPMDRNCLGGPATTIERIALISLESEFMRYMPHTLLPPYWNLMVLAATRPCDGEKLGSGYSERPGKTFRDNGLEFLKIVFTAIVILILRARSLKPRKLPPFKHSNN